MRKQNRYGSRILRTYRPSGALNQESSVVLIRVICVILLICDSDNYRPAGAVLVH